METTQRNISVQVQFWALLGPLIALITMMVIFVKASPQAFYLSFATISGVLISWKWKERGFFLSCLAVLVLYIYQYNEITPDERLWHIGMSFAIAIGFGITALTYQEVDSLLNFSKEEESFEALKLTLQREQALVQEIQQEVLAKQTQIDSYRELVDTVRMEAVKISTQHQKLLKDFLDKQLECSQLQERVTILAEQRALSSELEESVEKRDEEISSLRGQLQDLEHDLARVSEEMSNQVHIEKLEYEQIVFEMNDKIRATIQEKELIESLLMEKEQELTQKQIQIQLLETTKKEHEVIQSEIKKKDKELKSLQSLLSTKELEFQTVLLDKEAKIETSQQIKESLESMVASLQKDLQKVMEESSISSSSSSEMRRLEGLHKQLKLQFDEKSATLEAARKELFHTQEKLFGLEKEFQEIHVYDTDETSYALQKHLKHTIKDSETEIAQLEAEVASLYDIIDILQDSNG